MMTIRTGIVKRAGKLIWGIVMKIGLPLIRINNRTNILVMGRFLVEDVGRHNAADAIAGQMWKQGIQGHDKIMYTTGRVTSEIVIKSALMGIPILLSRSGITKMGLDIASDLNMVIIARAKGKKFIVYQGENHIDFKASQPVSSTCV